MKISDVAIARMRRWRAEPWVYVRDVLQVQPDDWQDEFLHALVAGTHKRFALKASKGPGKSAIESWAGWWFLTTRVHPKVVATSITGDNLKDGLWTEFAKWQARSPLLMAAFEWTADRISARQHRETWWASARTWPKSGDATQQANTLAGIHADAVMFILDESGGIPSAVMSAAEAGLANADAEQGREAIIIQAGNPTHTSGPLYEACTRNRAMWWVKEISGDPDDPKRAKRVDINWAREQIASHPGGREHPYVMVNVLGKFPPGQANTLIGINDAMAATQRTLHESAYINEVKVLGIDIARFGDDRSVLFPRQGNVAMRPKVFRNLDTMQLAAQAGSFIEKWRPDATFLDIATFGAGVYDRLQQLGYDCIGVDFGGKPNAPKYHNRRAEMWHGMAEWLVNGGCIPDDSELVAELTAPTYKINEGNHLQLEKKAELKKRIQVSPDKADALALTFAAPVAARSVREYLHIHQPRRNNDYDPLEERH